jgi:hypothetical protein
MRKIPCIILILFIVVAINAQEANQKLKTQKVNGPEFFINNKDKTFDYIVEAAFVGGNKGTAVVKEISDDKIVLSVTTTGENPMNGEIETRTYDYDIDYKDGKYSKGTMEDYYQEGELKTNSEGVLYLGLSGEQSYVSIIPQITKKEEFFTNNKDKTFDYIVEAAFVGGNKGTAVVKEISDDKIVLSVTTTGENPMNGEIETRTYDYDIDFKDGKYSKGTMEDYYQEGELKTNSEGVLYLGLSGEQSYVSIIPKE